MKRKNLVSVVLLSLITASMLAGCGNKAEKHEHNYTEEITVEATCETDGEATYTCECGDTYTEPIKATGHSFTNYVSNNDATYTADGTETAKCDNCDATDTRTAEGSMLTYTYTDMDATMYAQKTVNVRSLPNTDGEKVGSLSTNDEVKVTGQCTETSWYRIEYSGGVAYVSNSYLGNDKVVVQASAPASAPAQSASTSTEFPYELYTLYDNGTFFYYYTPYSDGVNKPQHWHDMADTCEAQNNTRFSDYSTFMDTIHAMGYYGEWNSTPYTINGEKVQMEIRW